MQKLLRFIEDFYFWKNLSLVIIFFALTPITLGIALYTLVSFSRLGEVEQEVLQKTPNSLQSPAWGARVYASLPSKIPSIDGEVDAQDAREELIRQYLSKYNSPLEPYASFIVQTADEYKLDFRLTTAIAQQESNLCKKIPPGSYNCWGWGIHSRGSLGFDSFEHGIEEVTKGLRENYLNDGLATIDDIMTRYTPFSDGSWSFAVNKFMFDLQ